GADSLMSTLASEGISTIPAYEVSSEAVAKAEAGSIFVTVGSYDGFDLLAPRIAVLSMAQSEGARIIANRRRQMIKRKLGSASERIMSYSDLTVGDLVVHESYGIGLFEGIQTVTVDGVTRDYITVKYAGEDKLLVPCDKLEYVSRYIGANDDNSKVKLSKMGGGDWLRTKTKAKSAAKDIADGLIKLYAERMRLPGFAFPQDSEMEIEFASQFEYEETEGQLTAIDEIKRDMMRPTPMNRLLCGDVGFGKTEVALRAAFKAIMGGKQVAFLVPTTILAMQHYQTALSRMRNYPVTVEMLTRFRTPKEEEAILRRAKRGEIDILIGTHKLLSKKLEFRDVGLLIVDEEQRFGVAQKEKLKQAFKNIDVLSLSATPIPRTLNMAMNGISDISVLDEAPGERVPVQTYVTEHDDGMIADAIKKELFRGGQVLYLYNKVEDIAFVADRIMRAIPEARVAYAHGQMDKDELEDIWQGLVRGEIDVLVCTTIIETGVDLPNANTLIIENADRFGLSQLHQIRGRVGRSQRQAYAYLTYRKGKVLTEIAEKRLSAIREFAEFGAGFKVALRDLEIRGAGNLLGAEQHGYIAGVGYDLYVKLLNEAVIESRGEKKEKRAEAEIEISASAHIPESYIGRASSRMEMYKKIALIRTAEDRVDVYDELCDRFGEPPRVTERLLDVALLKSLATEIGLRRVKQVGDSVWLDSVTPPELDLWSEVIDKHKRLSFRYGQYGFAMIRLKGGEDAAHVAAELLEDYFKIKEKSLKDENE
ncbi:MAG: transcription-repair coupling factor, partial [Clostridia bacterium]|nr:transcription-repair coupling factor [Clostridia bacterium]